MIVKGLTMLTMGVSVTLGRCLGTAVGALHSVLVFSRLVLSDASFPFPTGRLVSFAVVCSSPYYLPRPVLLMPCRSNKGGPSGKRGSSAQQTNSSRKRTKHAGYNGAGAQRGYEGAGWAQQQEYMGGYEGPAVYGGPGLAGAFKVRAHRGNHVCHACNSSVECC